MEPNTRAPNKRAQQNQETLFPGHISTLAVTDPELIETFDNFAFDEALSESNLDVGNDRAKLIDVLTQLLPFIGYPRTLNGLKAVDDVAPTH